VLEFLVLVFILVVTHHVAATAITILTVPAFIAHPLPADRAFHGRCGRKYGTYSLSLEALTQELPGVFPLLQHPREKRSFYTTS
jgi:hypothetical protein